MLKGNEWPLGPCDPPLSSSVACIMYRIFRMEPLWQSEDQSINLRWATGSKWTAKRRVRERKCRREREKLRGKQTSVYHFKLRWIKLRYVCIITPQGDNLFISKSIYLWFTHIQCFVFIKIFITKLNWERFIKAFKYYYLFGAIFMPKVTFHQVHGIIIEERFRQ